MYDGAQSFGCGGGLDDSDISFAANKQMSKSTIFPQNNYLTAFPENAKAPVAKIKVVVCFYSFAPQLLMNNLLLA
jgi:kinesin family protein 2/24